MTDRTGNGLPPEADKLFMALEALAADAVVLRRSMAGTHALPRRVLDGGQTLRLDVSGALFEHSDKKGERHIQLYHFIDNGKLSTSAQQAFVDLFGAVIQLNTMFETLRDESVPEAERPRLIEAIGRLADRVLAVAIYMAGVIACIPEATALVLLGRDDEALLTRFQERFMATAVRLMDGEIMPDIMSYWPRSDMGFIVVMGRPFEGGEGMFNGVWLSKPHFEAMRDYAARKQAEAMEEQRAA